MSRRTTQSSPFTTLSIASGGAPYYPPEISSTTGGGAPHSGASTFQHPGNNATYPSTPYVFPHTIPPMTPKVIPSIIHSGSDLSLQMPGSQQTRNSYSMDDTPQFSPTSYPTQPRTSRPPTPLQSPTSAPPLSIPHTSMPFISSMDPLTRPGAVPGGGYPPPQTPGSHHARGNNLMDYSGYPWGPPRPAYPQSQQPQPQPQRQPQPQHQPHPQYQPQPHQPQPTEPFPGAKWDGFTPDRPFMGYPWPQTQQPHPPLSQFQHQPPQFQQPQFAGLFPGMPWGGFIFGIMMGNPWLQMLQPQLPPLAPPMMQQAPPGPVPMQAPWVPSGHASNHGRDQVNPFMRGGEYCMYCLLLWSEACH